MQRVPRYTVLLLTLTALVFTSASGAANELVVAVTAFDQQQIPVSGIRFTYRGVESPPTTDAGMTKFNIPLAVGQDIPPGVALEIGLPGSLAKTWFLIDDTVHVPGPGEPPAEVVLMKRADIRRLAEKVRDARPQEDRELSPQEQRQRRLEVAQELGLSSEEELAAAIAAFQESAEDPMDEGVAHFLAQEYAQAEPFFRSALEQAEERQEEAEADIVQSARYLGQVLYAQTEYAEALDAFRRALAVQPDDPMLLVSMGSLLHEMAEWGEAEKMIRQSLSIFESRHGERHYGMGRALNLLALVLKETNRPTEAESVLRQAIEFDESMQGPDHPLVARDLNNLAFLLYDIGRLSEAETLARRSLLIAESRLGPEHPAVATALNNLAQVLKTTNHLSEAESLMRRALAIAESSKGSEHPVVATYSNNLALLLLPTQRLCEAGPLLRRALEITEARYGLDHPRVAAQLNNFGVWLEATNRHAEAEPLMVRAVEIIEARLVEGDPRLGRYRQSLEAFYEEVEKLEGEDPRPALPD